MKTIILISYIAHSILFIFFVHQFVLRLTGYVLFAVMFEGVRPTIIVICQIAASPQLHSLRHLLKDLAAGLAGLTFTLEIAGMSMANICICMTAVIIALLLLGIFIAFVYLEYDQGVRALIERFIMQRMPIGELTEEWKQLHPLLLKLLPSVSYTSHGIGSKFGDCTICLNDFVEGEHCWVLPMCKHAFHSSCVDPWLRTNLSCPVCRTPVLPV